jgi:hypothetical protein
MNSSIEQLGFIGRQTEHCTDTKLWLAALWIDQLVEPLLVSHLVWLGLGFGVSDILKQGRASLLSCRSSSPIHQSCQRFAA